MTLNVNLLDKGMQFLAKNGSRYTKKTVHEIEKSQLANCGQIGQIYKKSHIDEFFIENSDSFVKTTPKGFKQLWRKTPEQKSLMYSFKNNNDGTALMKVHVDSTNPNAKQKWIVTHILKEQGDDFIVTGFKHWGLENFGDKPVVTNIVKDANQTKGSRTVFRKIG